MNLKNQNKGSSGNPLLNSNSLKPRPKLLSLLNDYGDRDGVIARARTYVGKMPAAVSGEQGSKTTFHVACILVEKFELTYDEAIAPFLEYNERCDPPWTIGELNHKLVDALAQIGKPRPDKLRTDGGKYAEKPISRPRPELRGGMLFTQDDAVALSQQRCIPQQGIILAAMRGHLFKSLWRSVDCYGVKDVSHQLMELRRMDGQLFPAEPGTDLRPRKSHAIKNSNKKWPLGIYESKLFSYIALVEGVPDFLYAHYKIIDEGAQNRVAVVAMLSASPAIDERALPLFKGKTVRIFPHADETGLKGARKWKYQLLKAGAKHVDFFVIPPNLKKQDGSPVKDLCDLTQLPVSDLQNNETIKFIMP